MNPIDVFLLAFLPLGDLASLTPRELLLGAIAIGFLIHICIGLFDQEQESQHRVPIRIDQPHPGIPGPKKKPFRPKVGARGPST